MSAVASPAVHYHCHACDRPAPVVANTTCSGCNAPLSLHVNTTPDSSIFETAPRDQWHYRALLPVAPEGDPVTLGEGATSLLLASSDDRLWIKNEAANPTGSFKDRQVAVGITHARSLGHDTVAVVSSGNVACAAAAYAARAGMRAVVITHAHAAPQKLRQAAAYGATVLRVASPSAAEVFSLCIESCRQHGWYHLSTAGIYEPHNVEGAKTIAYELYHQFDSDLPEWVVIPVGGGGLLGGVWRGFLDLQRLGHIAQCPRLVGVQASGCAPLVRAMEREESVSDVLASPWINPETVAGALADDILFDAHTALPALRRTNGRAIAVSDPEILDAQARLAREEGLLCEPGSAVVFAALKHLSAIPTNERICCILSGTGMKDLDMLEPGIHSIVDVDPDPAALRRALGEVI